MHETLKQQIRNIVEEQGFVEKELEDEVSFTYFKQMCDMVVFLKAEKCYLVVPSAEAQ